MADLPESRGEYRSGSRTESRAFGREGRTVGRLGGPNRFGLKFGAAWGCQRHAQKNTGAHAPLTEQNATEGNLQQNAEHNGAADLDEHILMPKTAGYGLAPQQQIGTEIGQAAKQPDSQNAVDDRAVRDDVDV